MVDAELLPRFNCRRWEASSWGYHSSDGRKYHATEKGEDYGPSFGTGDTVGAGIHLGRKELFFT